MIISGVPPKSRRRISFSKTRSIETSDSYPVRSLHGMDSVVRRRNTYRGRSYKCGMDGFSCGNVKEKQTSGPYIVYSISPPPLHVGSSNHAFAAPFSSLNQNIRLNCKKLASTRSDGEDDTHPNLIHFHHRSSQCNCKPPKPEPTLIRARHQLGEKQVASASEGRGRLEGRQQLATTATCIRRSSMFGG